MNKQQKKLNAISSLQRMLTKENKRYMRKLHAYLMLASAFHEQEERATELLVVLVLLISLLYQKRQRLPSWGVTSPNRLDNASLQL
ncbi:TPA: hypothetical protein ACT2F6_000819 [Streptococcus suis]